MSTSVNSRHGHQCSPTPGMKNKKNANNCQQKNNNKLKNKTLGQFKTKAKRKVCFIISNCDSWNCKIRESMTIILPVRSKHTIFFKHYQCYSYKASEYCGRRQNYYKPIKKHHLPKRVTGEKRGKSAQVKSWLVLGLLLIGRKYNRVVFN